MDIKITGLSKKYLKSKEKSLDNINVTIGKGIYGLLGENGAGKTTLLKTLATIMPIQDGEIEINGKNIDTDIYEIRGLIGYLPQKFEFFNNLTVYEMLDYIALLKNPSQEEKQRNDEIHTIIDSFNLKEKTYSRVDSLSGGMKQRLAIAQALIGEPSLLIMDEPTVGLDPTERLRFRNIINEIAESRTVIISTHIISDISILCDNVGIMKKGKLIYSGPVDSLLEKVEGKVYICEIPKGQYIERTLDKNLISVIRKKNYIELRIISDRPIKEDSFKEAIPTLEDAYFYMMNYGS